MAATYDRTRQDLGNITLLEHVNVCVPDQRLATIFYVSGLGLTRGHRRFWRCLVLRLFGELLPPLVPFDLRRFLALVLAVLETTKRFADQ